MLKRVEPNFSPPLLLIFLPAKAEVLGVDLTRLELVTSAVRRQHEEFAVVRLGWRQVGVSCDHALPRT